MFILVKSLKTGEYFIQSKKAWKKAGFVKVFEGTYAKCLKKQKELLEEQKAVQT